MAVSAGGAVLQVTPQLVKTFSRDLATQLTGPATRSSERAGKEHGRRFGTSFSGGLRAGVGPVKGILRGFGPGLAAAFGGAAIVGAIKSVTDEAREAAVVGKQTAAVLKSTGGAANISAKQIGDLATALSNKSGVDDEAIQTSQNLLLTFRGVANEAGKGNDIFNQASASIVDMTAAMNGGEVTAQGLKASTIQVGKALNDPIKGMTALSRVGVTFNNQQKEQIKTLVESGDKLGAQKVILAELRKEFGGSAAASADAGKRFGVFIGNLKEQIGTALLPLLNRLLGFLVDKLPGALNRVGGFFHTVAVGVQALVAAFKEGDVTSDGFVGVMEQIGVAVRTVWGTLVRLLVPAIQSIADAVRPALKAFVDGLLPGLRSLWHVVQSQVFPALKVLAAIIGVTLYADLKYVLPLILRLAGPVLGFLFKQIGQTIQWISNVIRFIGRLGAWFLRWITGTKTTGAAVQELGRRVGVFAANMSRQWRQIVNQISGALGALRRVTTTVLSALIRFWLRWAGNIVDAAAHALGWMPGLGPKLRTAAAKFHEFAGSVNRALNKIDDEGVTVRLKSTFTPPKGFSMHSIVGAQHGIRLPGYGGGDRIPAMLEAGEAVVPKEAVRDRGFQAWAGRQGIPGFRQGGLVLHPEFFSTAAMERTQEGIDARVAGKTAAGIRRNYKLLLSAAKPAILAFIRSVDPLPYIWGGAGPGGYDCSGLVGAVYGKHTGRGGGHGQRYFTTATISASGGLKPGLGGTLDIGVTPARGHMVGRYGNLGFEAESTRTGIKVGAAATRPESMARHYHLRRGGLVDRDLLDLLARRGADIGGDPGRLRIDGQVFDRGGTLAPGLNLLANRTGRPEHLIPAGQGGVTVNVTVNGAVGSPKEIARVLIPEIRQGLKDAQRRGGVPPAQQLR